MPDCRVPGHHPVEPIRPDQTVADVVHRRAGALEVMKTLGIDHCCGARLTLGEAAAAAGVPLGRLLSALGEPEPGAPSRTATRRVLDVRGLEPPLPLVRVLETLDGLGPGDTLEVRHDRRPVLLYPQLEDRGFVHETDEPEPGLVRVLIRQRAA